MMLRFSRATASPASPVPLPPLTRSSSPSDTGHSSHRRRGGRLLFGLTACSLHFLLLLVLFLNHLPASCQARVSRDTSDTDNHLTIDDFSPADDGNGSSVPFIDVANLKDLDLAELLEINFINNSVHHYRGKFQQVHSSLQGRIRELIANVRGSSQASQFSPELKAKLTDSFLKLVEQLNLSPLCLTSLNHLRMEIMEKRLWPLKCKFIKFITYSDSLVD